jgi:hypothetical protein
MVKRIRMATISACAVGIAPAAWAHETGRPHHHYHHLHHHHHHYHH